MLGTLRIRAERLGSAEPGHFVFPACEHGKVDPLRPMKGWRTAWRNLTKAVGLKGLRFHDLRHQAITEVAERSQADQTIMGYERESGKTCILRGFLRDAYLARDS